MRKIPLAFSLLFCFYNGATAQKFYVPDANFRIFLQSNYPSCFVGDSLDTQCETVKSTTVLDCSNKNIANLSGVQYFTSLAKLYCSNNKLASFPALPNSPTVARLHRVTKIM